MANEDKEASADNVKTDRTEKRLSATGILSTIFALILGIAALAACAPTQTQTNVKSPTVTPQASATAAPRLVYAADWSHGLAGWAATPGWSVSGGVLQSDTGRDRKITIPFRPTTPDYAVEFRLQIVTVSPSPTAATEYSLSADPSADVDGYLALFDHVMLHQCMFACHPHEAIYIDPMVDQNVGTGTVQIHDFEPHNHVLTYRVEVHGSLATLVIDGRIASQARSSRTPQLAAGPLHFYCTGVALRLSDLKVYSL